MNEGEERITLTDEEGNETEFFVLGNLEINDKLYVAFEPVENEEDEYVILRVETDENGEETLATIDDDVEFDAVAEAFENEFMDSVDLDEAYGDEENEDEGDDEEENAD